MNVSKYLTIGAQLQAKATSLTEEQMKVVKAMEKQIATLKETCDMAILAIQQDLIKKQITQAQAECEEAIAKAHTKAAIESIETKIKEINPMWASDAAESAKLVAQNLSVKGLELVGKGFGFLGRAFETAKAAAKEENTGAFVAPKKTSILDTLQ
jgi:hypothetical protein